MSEPLLRARDVYTAYGLSQVLFGVSLDVARGECVSLLGRNGVGKTTTMRSIMGLTPPARGRVEWKGRDITGRPPHEIAKAGLGFVPEDRRIFADLTVEENLLVGRRADARGWTAERVFRFFPKLGELARRQGGSLSGGEQQMLTVARTLMGNPLLVLLDEPSEGVAPVIVEQMANTIVELKKEGLSVLLSEQNIHFAGLVCDRAYVLEKGQIRWHGGMAELADDVAVQRRLLSV
jgi:branched-chain amino acid transport system ATP-binding protein